MGGKRPVLLAGQRAFILERIALKPHISIRALQAELARHGTRASYGAVWTFLHRQDMSHKKAQGRPAQGTSAQHRCRRRGDCARLDKLLIRRMRQLLQTRRIRLNLK
jgi:transposase